jgi:hypothetical protein
LFKLTGLPREPSRRRVLGIAESDLAKLAAVIGVGNCAMLEFEDGAVRLLRSRPGIDPGAGGAIAALDEAGDLLEVVDMPATSETTGRTATSAPLLAGILPTRFQNG